MTDRANAETKKARRRRGPAPKDPAEVMATPLRVRVTEGQLAAIRQRAERSGYTLAGYVRRAVLGAEVRAISTVPPVDKQLAARVLGQLGKIGNNLNQLARSANEGVTLAEVDIYAACAALIELRAACFEALGRTGARGEQ